MLGLHQNFPANIHKTVLFTTPLSIKRLQQTIIQAFYEMNAKSFKIEDVTTPSLPHCTVIFEFGIAEANTFNYLDKEEAERALKAIKKKPLQVTDFFCAIRYYQTHNNKKTPLKFDYYMIRFTYNKNSTEMQIFHERGPRYVPPDDLAALIVNKINGKFLIRH